MISPIRSILLFGSPVDAADRLDSMAPLLSTQKNDKSESRAMLSMKNDAAWLRAQNTRFRGIESQFRLIYFREATSNHTETPKTVSSSCFFHFEEG